MNRRYTCECGFFQKNSVHNFLLEKVCPKCNTHLRQRDISKQTKIESYYNLDEETMTTRRNKVYKCLLQQPATDQELAKKLGYNDPNFVRPRRKELVDLNMIKPLFKRECTVTHKTVTVWGI